MNGNMEKRTHTKAHNKEEDKNRENRRGQRKLTLFKFIISMSPKFNQTCQSKFDIEQF